MKIFDLKSDTITKPREAMRKAMYQAEVGDDVYREDPTINKLEEYSAKLLGKDAGLFVPTGSMGNLIPLYLNCGKGNEVLTHEKSHIIHYELASVSAIAGALPIPVAGARGILHPEALEGKIRPEVYYVARTKMIEIENTHNLEGGTCYQKEELAAVKKFAQKHNLTVHMDGARLFNAVISTGMSAKTISSYADTVTFCLSKGLGAPVGSLLCGDKYFIQEARRIRKMLGGGMRQAGILAAAGLYALENNVERLAEDHENAKQLARILSKTDWAMVDPHRVETNIFLCSVKGGKAKAAWKALKDRGILTSFLSEDSIRIVTSLEISSQDVKEIEEIIESLSFK